MGPVAIMAVAIFKDSEGRLSTVTYWLATEFFRLWASLMILYRLYCKGSTVLFCRNREDWYHSFQ